MDRSKGYEPRWDINLAEGKEGEKLVAHVLGLEEKDVEVKRKSYRDFHFYVETSHKPKGSSHYKPSGINVTESAFFAYVIESTGMIVLIPVDRLRWAAREGRYAEEDDGDCPTRGRMVGAVELFPEHETYGLEEVCGRCGGDDDVGPGRAISESQYVYLCKKCWWGFATGKIGTTPAGGMDAQRRDPRTGNGGPPASGPSVANPEAEA